MQTAESKPIYYMSVHRHGVDEKRRVQIPAKWRSGDEDAELTMIVWPKASQGPCLRVLPPKQMAELMQELTQMPSSDPNKGLLKRFIGSRSVQVSLDKSGRVCIPEDLAKAAGITSEAVFVGLMDRFEIWSPERYASLDAVDEAMAPMAFSRLE
jgi:MraZ protein